MTNSPQYIVFDDLIIIDDIILCSNHVSNILHYFPCVVRVFAKYRISFKLSKYNFLQPHVEYIGHDIIAHGNCPAASKFYLLQSWFLPPTESRFYPSSICISIIDISLGLKPGLKHCENCTDFIITMISL